MTSYADPDEEFKYWLKEIDDASTDLVNNVRESKERYDKALGVLRERFPWGNS